MLKTLSLLSLCSRVTAGRLSTADSCRQQLLADGNCCLDQRVNRDVLQRRLSRPGTTWQCASKDGCVSGDGQRGGDFVALPPDATCETCRILFLHGGSWYYGSPETDGYKALATKLAHRTRCVIMLPDFPLLPVGKFHSMLAASIAALQYLSTYQVWASCRPSTPVDMFVGGDSSGGSTALSVVLRWKLDPDILPSHASLAGGFFWSPWTNLMCNTPEYITNAYMHAPPPTEISDHVGDILFTQRPVDNMAMFRKNALEYVGGRVEMLKDPIASPFYADSEWQAGPGMASPALYFAVGSSETILGDTTILAEKAAAKGVQVVVDIFHGMWHDFPMYSDGCGSEQPLWSGQRAWNNTVEFLKAASATASAAKGGGSGGWPLIRYVYDESASGRAGWFPTARPLLLGLGPASAEGHPRLQSLLFMLCGGFLGHLMSMGFGPLKIAAQKLLEKKHEFAKPEEMAPLIEPSRIPRQYS